MSILTWLLEGNKPVPNCIEDAPAGTMLVHRERGTVVRSYESETDAYYHQEAAADELCVRGCISVEIKDITGKVYRYSRESLQRAGWL